MRGLRQIEPCETRWTSGSEHDDGWHRCTSSDSLHLGDHICICRDRTPGLLGDPDARPLSRRQRFARWRVRRWDAKVTEARAAYQASIAANGQGDYWWERELTIACGKRALWKHRAENW